MRSMEIAFSLGGASLSFRDQLALAQEAEANGFDAIGAGDMANETFALHGALAVTTTRVKLVSTIATWTRSPATMANGATTLAQLSGGRFTLGLGPAPQRWIEEHHGQQFTPAVGRFREYVQAVRACLEASTEHPTAFDGKHFPTHGYTNWNVPYPGRVPIVTAATRARMTELAGEVADGLMVNIMHPVSWIRTEGRELVEKGMARAGRTGVPFTMGAGRFAGIDDDREAAYDICRWQLARYFEVPYLRALLEPLGFEQEMEIGEKAYHAGDFAGAVAAVSDRMVDEIALAGTPDEVRAKLGEYEGALDWVSLYGGVEGDQARSGRNTRHLVELFAPTRTAVG
jgi:5,10-methylenetetrahydromethanopterin reductase